MADDLNYIKFSTQYANALVRFNYPETGVKPADNGFWFGRMVGYPYELVNFEGDGVSRSGRVFWNQLHSKVVQVSIFTLDTIGSYEDIPAGDPDAPAATTGATKRVQVEGKMIYSRDGFEYRAAVTLTHYLRPTWVAVKTVYNSWV